MRLCLFLLLGAITGCSSLPCEELPSGKVLKDPQKLLPTFQAFIQCGEYARAHKCLSRSAKSAVPYEAFYGAMTAFEITAKMIGGLQEHGIDTEAGTMQVCNPEFGIDRKFRIKGEFGGRLWTLDFSREDLTYLQDQAKQWFEEQRKVAGGRIHVYPPNWTYSKLIFKCRCTKNG